MADLLDNNGRTASWARVHKLEMNSPLAEILQEMFGGDILIKPGYRRRVPSKITKDCQHIAARTSRPQPWWSVHIAIDYDVEGDQARSHNNGPLLSKGKQTFTAHSTPLLATGRRAHFASEVLQLQERRP